MRGTTNRFVQLEAIGIERFLMVIVIKDHELCNVAPLLLINQLTSEYQNVSISVDTRYEYNTNFHLRAIFYQVFIFERIITR